MRWHFVEDTGVACDSDGYSNKVHAVKWMQVTKTREPAETRQRMKKALMEQQHRSALTPAPAAEIVVTVYNRGLKLCCVQVLCEADVVWVVGGLQFEGK